jgi:hypothetical protein
MQLVEYDMRLIALNDEGTAGCVWSVDKKEWGVIGATFARQTAYKGLPLTEAEATDEFPGVELLANPPPIEDEAGRVIYNELGREPINDCYWRAG